MKLFEERENMEVPRHWRLKKQRYSLAGEICPRCETYLFPPRAVCPTCADRAREAQPYVERQPVLVLAEQAQPASR
jgi:uncharacterized OB-fold protein